MMFTAHLNIQITFSWVTVWSTCIVIDIFKSVWDHGIINKEGIYMSIYIYNSSSFKLSEY